MNAADATAVKDFVSRVVPWPTNDGPGYTNAHRQDDRAPSRLIAETGDRRAPDQVASVTGDHTNDN